MPKRKALAIEQAVNDLRAAAPQGPNYTETDRYREFRRVFLGSDEGRRVLWHIMDLGGLFGTSFDPNPHIHAQNEGWRNLAVRIFQIIHKEPQAKPTRQNVKRDSNA
jgi:hypothetical protein